MKVLGKILKVLAALAAVAGAIYVVATYGDKIVAWSKGLLSRFGCCGEQECVCDECDCDCTCDDACECTCECDCQEPEAPAAEEAADTVQAEEADFQG